MNGLLFITHQNERFSYLESLKLALQGGCSLIQLRMKDATPDEVERVAAEALPLCLENDAWLFIDDHVDVCLKVHADGVHLGKDDMRPKEARKILGPDYAIGGTANTFNDIKRLAKEGVHYIGLGPFRFTETKKNLSPELGIEGYRTILAQCQEGGIDLPIFAIGGITRADIPELMSSGISGVAISSAILTADDPVAETQLIIQEIEKYEI